MTAAGGGGQTSNVIHSNATVAQGWEWFTFSCTTSTFDPRNCTNMETCWSADVNGDGVMDAVGMVSASIPFMGMSNMAVVDYSKAGHPRTSARATRFW